MAKQTGAGSSFTNHPGIAEFKGKSYFFYHNGALPGGGGYKRSVCVEEFTYGTDGTIPTIKMTKEGPAPIAILNPFLQVEAETIAFSSGLKTEVCTDTDGGINVSSINSGDYIKVRNVDFADGVTSFDARVSSSVSGAKIELHLDSQTGTLLGTCDVSGATSWTTKTCEVTGGAGKHDLFMKFVGGSGDLFKFNWWKFKGPRMPDPSGGSDGGAGGGAGGTDGGAIGTGGTGGSTGTRTTSSSSTGGKGGTASQGGASTGGRSTSTSSSAGAVSSGGSVSSSAPSSASGGSSSAAGGSISSGQSSAGSSASTSTASSGDSGGCSCSLAPHRGQGCFLALAAMLFLVGARSRSKKSR
jgi:hypothetical protein